MRCPLVLAFFCCFASVFALAASSSAQSPNQPVYPGSSQTIYPNVVNDETDGAVGYWSIGWTVGGRNYTESGHGGATPNADGWAVNRTTKGYTIAAPAGATVATNYSFTFTYRSNGGRTSDTFISFGDTGIFDVVAAPPTLPPAGNPAFSWQGSVAGVNTGNGNKTTTLPIVGWTQRGGMPVSCTLYHNSQGAIYSTAPYGYKWNPSYFSYISGGSSAPTLHWDNGLTYTFTNSNGTYIPPYGILDKLTYSNGVFTLTTTSQTVYTFGYASSNAYLSAITDMDGNTLTINHQNGDNTISSVVDSTGRTLNYTYSGGHLTTVTDPLGRQWVFNYVSGSYLASLQLPPVNGQAYGLGFGYGDGRQNITQFMDARGNSSTYTYNGNNSLATAKDPMGNQTTFTYNPASTVITDPNGHTTTHTYAASHLASVTDALNYSSSTAYDYNNIATSTTDKRGNVWNYLSHFSSGNSTSTSTDPLNYSSSSTYDGKNKVVQSVDAMGNVTANTYTQDSKEDLLTTSIAGTGSYPFKATSSVGGYSNGLPTTFTDPLNFASSVGYDGNGNVNQTVDANHHLSTLGSTPLGWKLYSTDANNHTTANTYDNWGRVTAVTAPDNTQTTMAYDASGNVLTVTDADNHTVTNIYDADNRLIQTTNGRGDVVKYNYDGADYFTGAPQKGLLSSKTDGNGHTTFYNYTARNEPAATYYADGTSESVTYDASGNTLTRTKADGKMISYAYDKEVVVSVRLSFAFTG